MIADDRHRFCFQMMAYFGLRISEAAIVKLEDIDLAHRTLRVWNVKRKIWQHMHIHDLGAVLITKYLEWYGTACKKHDGFVIYNPYGRARAMHPSAKPAGNKKDHGVVPAERLNELHLSADYLRGKFKEYVIAAGLDYVYKELPTVPGQRGKTRKLLRLSSHSLRHTYIDMVYKASKDPLATQYAARHSSLRSTECYLQGKNDLARQAIDAAFKL